MPTMWYDSVVSRLASSGLSVAWTAPTRDYIILNGTACSGLQSGTLSDFQFIYTCSTGTICIDRTSDGGCASGGP